MKKIGFALLLAIFVIAMANNTTSAKHKRGKSVEEILNDQVKVFKWMLERMQRDRAQQEFEEREITLLAEGIYHENWHTDKEKKTARWTGGVVMNRVNSSEYPDTVEGVLYERGQYSTTKKFFTVKLPDECYEMARDIYYNGCPEMPKSVVFQAQFRQGKGTWQKLNGEYFCYE